MKVSNYMPGLVAGRLKSVSRRLNELVWSGRQPVQVMGGPINPVPISIEDASKQQYKTVAPGEYFGPPGGGFQQRWFIVNIPENGMMSSGKRTLHWKCAGETTVYYNGVPIAGFDPPHQHCILPDGSFTLWLDCSTCQTWMWPGTGLQPDRFGLQFQDAYISIRDEAMWQAYWDFKIFTEILEYYTCKAPEIGVAEYPDKIPGVFRRLSYKLNNICDLFDKGFMGDFISELHSLYIGFPVEYWQLEAAFCGHMHIDLIHLWPQFQSERKAVHSFANSVGLMKRYPELKMTQSQPALYDAVKKLAPQLCDEIESYIKEGRWEPTGGFDVEADVNIPCGEALLRSLAYGQERLFTMRGGRQNKILWLPDCFGFSNCLPQMMSLAGVDYFYTQKQICRQVTKFPQNTFRWKGPDGSSVIAHAGLMSYTGPENTGELIDCGAKYQQADVLEEFMLPMGHGDGGGGPTEAMCERVRRWNNIVGVPKSSWSKAEEFFEKAERSSDLLPTVEGEIPIEFHRGTYTSESTLKLAYRRLERALQVREAARAVKGLPAIGYEAWKRLLYIQFHDCISGPSLKMCYDSIIPEISRLGIENLEKAAAEFSSGERQSYLTVFNPLAIPRECIFETPAGELDFTKAHNSFLGLKSLDGRVFPIQIIDSEKNAVVLIRAKMDGLESISLLPVAVDLEYANPLTVSAGVLDNGITRVAFDSSGLIAALSVNGKSLELAEPACPALYPDYPSENDAWDIDRHTLKLGSRIDAGMCLEIKELGPVRAILEGRVSCGEYSRMTVKYILEAGSPWLRIVFDIDWHESHKLLKYLIPTGYRGNNARYGSPFGSVLRSQKEGKLSEEAMWEVPASRWAIVSDDSSSEGLALVAEAKYGFSCIDGQLGVSLLRSPKHPNPESDMGRHCIRMAVGVHDIEHIESQLCPVAAETLFAEILIAKGIGGPASFGLSNTGSLVPSWVLPSEKHNGIIVRMHETMGCSGEAKLTISDKFKAVKFIDFLENTANVEEPENGVYIIKYKPYKIYSILLEKKDV